MAAGGGGTGAFSTTLCRHYPNLTATIIDFPTVRTVAEQTLTEAGLADRVTFYAGNTLPSEWPKGQDVVLMSYLLSPIAEQDGRTLIRYAFDVLEPDGLLILHDSMTDDDRTEPAPAALWLLANVLMDPDVPGPVSASGFTDISVTDVIPSITKVLIARKPSG